MRGQAGFTRESGGRDAGFAGEMSRSFSRSLLSLLAFSGLLVFAAAAARAGDEPLAAPLPDARAFLDEVRERIHTDDFLLDQYTFTEKQTERRLDGDGKVTKITSASYEVYPSAEPGHTYRKLVERDGKPLPVDDLAKEDRKQQEKEARAAARSPEVQAERRRKEAQAIEELFRLYDIRVVGREAVEGREAVLVTFASRPGVETTTRAGKVLKKFSGRAWIDEADRQLVRVEAELTDDLSFGFGILAKVKKGSRAEMQRRKINDEVWLPAEARFVGRARLFLVKGINIDTLSEYSDYKKFTVATEAAAMPQN
jgi:hypothetical protein